MLTLSGAVSAAKAFKDALKGAVVSPAEIRRREEICSTCPKRENSIGTVSTVSKILGVLANKHRVPRDITNYRCGVCGCNFALLIPATKEGLHKDSPAEAKMRPGICWLTDASK